jgi:LacI family transcriptional regulator
MQPVANYNRLHKLAVKGEIVELNIRTLAQLAGTSYSTVSRALNDSPLVKDATKRRIQELARQLGYHVDFSAKSLATGMRMIVGILYPFHSLRPYESVYTSHAISRMRHALSRHGLDALIAGFGDGGTQADDITRLIRQKKVDGLIIFGYEVSDDQIAALLSLNAPFLLINPSPSAALKGCNQICIDHRYGGYLAGKRLIEAGRRRLLCVTEEGRQFEVRTEGFQRAIEETGGTVSHETLLLENGLYETAYAAVTGNIDFIREFDGVFVQSDVSSFGFLNCLLDHRVAVPEELSLIGYDDVEWAQYSRPALTTVHQPVHEVARLATEGIVSMITGDQDRLFSETLRPALVDRESC